MHSFLALARGRRAARMARARQALALLLVIPAGAGALAAQAPRATAATDWTAYGHDAAGSRFSPAARITPENVARLRPVWRFRTGDLLPLDEPGRFEATPLSVDGTLYLSTPMGSVIALDPVRGTERWRYDAHVDLHADFGDFASRGVSTWLDPSAAPGSTCRRTIYFAPVDARLIALDAATGRPCAGFGDHGVVELARDVTNPPAYPGEYEVTSPPAVVGGLVIVGSAIADNQRADAPSGVVRAYDARTGALRWRWDPIPREPGSPAWSTWQGPVAHRTGAANAWSLMSVDSARGLVFIPVGSASPDFYGGERLGQNLYANSVVALRASTGKLVWHFQVVHHDLWDYDVPAQPVLVTLHRDGRAVDAVVVATKMGHLFVLDRETGKPLFPVEERAVPASDVPGEHAWPTQPFPVTPAPLTPERLTPDEAWGATPAERAECRARIASLRNEGVFTPPSRRGTLIFPGNIGGSYWAGVAWDPVHGLLIAPTNRLAFVVRLVPRDSLMDERHRFPHSEVSRQRGTPYGMRRELLMSSRGIPCNPPPWGTIAAVDLSSGAKRWESPFGFTPQAGTDSAARRWGSVNLGGAMVTAGGLVFASGGFDGRLHAYDVRTGRELWSAALPAGGNAMPMTYVARDGRQYVVISAGGHDRMHTPPGDWVVAFALPSSGSAADTASADGGAALPALDGSWRGEIRVGGGRYPVTWVLARNGARLTGTFAGSGKESLQGSIEGSVAGDTLRFTSSWTLPARDCHGTFDADGTPDDAGTLIEGRIRLTASCGDHEEPGVFVMRRGAGSGLTRTSL